MSNIQITANSRLTQSLKQQAFAQQLQSVAETPQVMTLAQWWTQWERGCLLRGELSLEAIGATTLSPFETQLVWEQALEAVLKDPQAPWKDDDGAPLSLLNPVSTAKQLHQAWSLWMEWLSESQREASEQLHFDAPEVALFKKVAEHYQRLLDTHGWRDEVAYQQQRLHWLQEGKGRLPACFELYGFDELTPLMSRWRDIVQQRGSQVHEKMPAQTSLPACERYVAHDMVDEVQRVAQWCVQQWQALQEIKPAHQIAIGVVAPNLADCKSALCQALDEQLALAGLQSLQLQSQGGEALYNVSLGEPLSEALMVKNALQSLNVFLQPQKTLDYALWSEWLLSPYTLGELAQRHRTDAQLRRLQWASFRWPMLLASEAAQTTFPKGLLNRLQRWQETLQQKETGRMSVAEFVDLAENCLQQIGWASGKTLDKSGGHALNSDEQQQKNAFYEALTQFRQLGNTQGKRRMSEWLAWLQRFTSERVHQSQSVGLQPIQVIGMLEAGGQRFDALWVMGLSDEAWPRMPNPNPFLPMALQRQYGLPRCDAQRELRYAQHVTRRLRLAAPHQVWSYARFDAEAERLPSALLESELFAEAKIYHPPAYETLAQSARRLGVQPEWVLDERGPEIASGTLVPGGSGILQAQNVCPLMAFVDFRLGARKGLESVEEGLQSTNQGTLIHAILQNFWEQVRTQPALLALSDEALQQRLQGLIEQEFATLQNRFDVPYLQLEQARILQLLVQWLALEKQRANFSVTHTEQAVEVELAGVRFKLIIDRIDEVAGAPVILDYKTGKASVNDLIKTPLRAPQLAVYLHALDTSVAGIGYGLLHSDDGVRLSALGETDEVFGELSQQRSVQVFARLAENPKHELYDVHWEDLLESLKQAVANLAQSVQQGEAQMRFDKPADLAYAAGYLALRVPEVEAQLSVVGRHMEASE